MNFFIKNRVIYITLYLFLAYAAEFRAVTEEFSVEFRQNPLSPTDSSLKRESKRQATVL